ncbi:hypothetical protein SH449x_004227 [Pirellulaceae bacterium SH449]
MTRSMYIVVFVVIVVFADRMRLIAQDSAEENICKLAIAQQQRLESISAFKLHGFVRISFSGNPEMQNSENQVWIESRGDKVFMKTREIDSAANQAHRDRLAQLLDSDLANISIFDGRSLVLYEPIRMGVTIEPAERFNGLVAREMFPRSWTSFSMEPNPGKITFSNFLNERIAESKLQLSHTDNRLTVMYTNQSGQSVGFKDRTLKIDAQTGLIVKSEASGGFALPVVSNLEWSESDGTWFVSKGQVLRGHDKSQRTIEWEILEFTADPSEVRSDFKLVETTLPIGTLIESKPQGGQGPASTRYIGGEEGRREHNVKMHAIHLTIDRNKHE